MSAVRTQSCASHPVTSTSAQTQRGCPPPFSSGDLWDRDQERNYNLTRLSSPGWIVTVSLADSLWMAYVFFEALEGSCPGQAPACQLSPPPPARSLSSPPSVSCFPFSHSGSSSYITESSNEADTHLGVTSSSRLTRSSLWLQGGKHLPISPQEGKK